MNNVDLIKQNLLPLLVLKKDNQFKEVFLNAWKTDFIKSMISLNKGIIIDRDMLEGFTFEKALNKYASYINEWSPKETTDVFWIKGIKIYDINQYPVLKEFYNKDKDELFKALINIKSSHKEKNKEVLLNLALNHDLELKHFKIFEKKNIQFIKYKAENSFVKETEPSFDYFEELVKISQQYNRNLIWEYYVEYFKSNQIFLNSVKEYLKEKKIEYNFEEKELNLLSRDNFTRTIQINPESVCQINPKIKTSMIENLIIGLNNYYHEMAKEIEEDCEMGVEVHTAKKRTIMLHFKSLNSLQEYEEKLKLFHINIKSIIEKIELDKNKPPSVYKEEIGKIHMYHNLDNKFPERNKEKLKKI